MLSVNVKMGVAIPPIGVPMGGASDSSPRLSERAENCAGPTGSRNSVENNEVE